MTSPRDEAKRPQQVAIQNAEGSLQAPPRVEEEFARANVELEAKSKELARSLSLLQATLESAVDPILVTDSEGRITAYNRRFLELWELTPAAMKDIGRGELLLRMSLKLQQPEPFLSRCDELAIAPIPESFDHLTLYDGRIVEQITKPHTVEDRAVGRVWSFRDVTERRRLEENRFRLAAVVESSDDAIVSKTLEGTVITWNGSAERMFGYSAEEMIGRSISLVIPNERLHEEAEILALLERGQRMEGFETVRVRKDGRRIDVSLTISPIKDADGIVIGISKIARDITVRRRRDEELREETRMLNLLNSTGTAIAAELDIQTLLQTVTDSATQLSGAEFGAFFYNTTDDQGDAFLLYTLSGAPRAAFEQLGKPRATALFGPTFRGEAPIRIADVKQDPRYGQFAPHHGMPPGHLPVRSYLAVPVVSLTSEVIGGLFFGHSEPNVFTERIERVIVGVAAQAATAIDNARLYERVRAASEERKHLLEAERAARSEAERVSLIKDEFLATLSHELRTPLNAIVGWAQILRMQGGVGDDTNEGLAVIERNARIQAQLIDDLLDMSRIISGKLHLEIERVDVQDVVKAAVASVRHSAESKGVALHAMLDPLAGPVRGDPSRLQQCFWNLLSNAIKFTPKGGHVQVSLVRNASRVRVNVTDDGQGIAPDFLPHVFERFRQADASTTRRHGGLGLGLSIVKNLIELHGGDIDVSSAGLGKGATFRIDLPVMILDEAAHESRRERARAAPTSPQAFDQPVLDGLTILAVDDEADARTLIKRVLEECGARVLVAASAAEGLALVRREKPHMIVSDIGMPDVDGYEFIRQVRRLSPAEGGRIPAAALSAFARAEDRTRALRAGYQTHLAKPVEPSELTAVIFSLAARS
jgi:PAS domain S-box-containing protein